MSEDASSDEKDAKPSAAKPPGKSQTGRKPAAQLLLRVLLGTAGLMLVVGFFLPWLNLDQLASVSGMQLVMDPNPMVRALVGADAQRYMLLVVPGFGLVLTAIGFLGFRWSGPVSAVLGVLVILYGIVTTIIFFFQKTGIGLWMILGGACIAMASGAFVWARSRNAKPVATPEE